MVVLRGDFFRGGAIISSRGYIRGDMYISTSAPAISSHFYGCIISLALGLQLTLAHCVHFFGNPLGLSWKDDQVLGSLCLDSIGAYISIFT